MKKLIIFTIAILLLSGCVSFKNQTIDRESVYLRILSERGRPDSVFDDYLNNRKILMYYSNAYVFKMSTMELLEVKSGASIAFLYKVESTE